MRRFVSLTTVAGVAAICLSACGGSSSPGRTTASRAAKRAGSMLALARCIRANGVPNFPDPTGNGGGISVNRTPTGAMTVNGVAVNGPAFQGAMRKCNSEMPQGPPVTAAQLAKVRAGALKMATCMRNHGVTNFPDPVVKAGPGGRGIEMSVGAGAGPGGPDSQSPAFQQAQNACGMGFPAVRGNGNSGAAGTTKSTAKAPR